MNVIRPTTPDRYERILWLVRVASSGAALLSHAPGAARTIAEVIRTFLTWH